MRTVRKKGERGFTLVELVMVVVIIGVLSAIIVPKYMSYVERSADATTKANLQVLRSAIQNYRSDNNGTVPNPLSQLVTSDYLPSIPTDGKNQSAAVKDSSTANGNGGWIYDATDGTVVPDLSGQDYRGINYSSY